jgi:dinuclear metal center YbgI/SA1388 family protein
VKIKDVLSALENFAPLPLQEDYDNAGLQIGLTEAEVSGALLCLDVTEKVVDEAMRNGCNLIVAHHPLIFRPLRHISDTTYVERAVLKAIKNDIAIVAMHTNMDNAEGGVNYKIAERLGLKGVRLMAEKSVGDTIGGSGVVGELPEPLAASDFISLVKERFGVSVAQCNELLNRPVKTVALCGGAGSFLLGDAIRNGADAFITGEMSYHAFFGSEQRIQIVVIGHYESEQFTNEIFKTIIEERCPGVRCVLTHVNTNPINYL